MMKWYLNLTLQERQFVWLGAFFGTLILLYLLLYQPLGQVLEDNSDRLNLKQSELAQLISIINEYKALGVSKNSGVSSDNRSLLAVIDQSGSVIGIKSSIKRLTPEGKHKVRVRVEDIAFDKLIKWLVTNSTKHSIHAELFLVRETEQKGRVNATLLFTRS